MNMFGLGILLNAQDKASASIYRVDLALNTLSNTLRKTGQVSKEEMNGIEDSINSANNRIIEGLGLMEIGSELTSFSKALVSPIASIGKQAISTGSQFEQWRMTLEALYKDADLAKEKLQWGMNLAAQTPFEVKDVTEALIGFKAVGAEADTMFTNANGQARSFLEYMGDLASLRPDVGLQGVLLGVRNLLGGDGGKSLRMRMDIDFEQILGRDFGSTTEEIMQDLVEVSDKLANGLMTKLEGTWEQMISNLEDQSTRFYLAVADQGAFDTVKQSLKYVSDAVASIDDDRMARIGKNIAEALNMIVKPLDYVIRKLTDFGMAIVNLMETNPLVAKLVVGFVSIVSAGLLAVGVLFSLSGILLVLRAGLDLVSPKLQILRYRLFGVGGMVSTVLPKIALMVGAFTLVRKMWTSDFGGIRTALTNFMQNIYTAFSYSTEISRMSVNDMLKALSELDTTTFGGWLTYRLTQLKVLWIGLCDAWNDYELSDENFAKLDALGLMPLLTRILEIKMRAEEFFKGFAEGFSKVTDVVVSLVEKVGEITGKIIAFLFPIDDSIESIKDSVNDTDFSGWRDFGETLAYIIAGLGALKLVSSIFTTLGTIGKVVMSVGTLLWNGVQLVWGAVKLIWTSLKLVGSVIGGLLTGIGQLTIGILSFFGIVTTLPAWLVGAITLAVITVVALVIKYWDKIVEFTKNMWAKVCEYASAIGEWFAKVWKGICDSAKTLWDNVVQFGKDAWDGIIDFMQPVINFFKGLGQILVGIFQIAWSVISGACKIAWNVIKLVVGLAWEGIKVIVKGAWDFIVAIWNGAVTFFSTIWNFIYKNIITPIWNGIVSIIKGAFNIILNVWNGIANFFSTIWNFVYNNIITPIWNFIVACVTNAYNKMVNIWNGITNFFSVVWNFVYNNIITPIWNFIVTCITNAYNSLLVLWEGIKEFFSVIWNFVYNNIILPIWNGIVAFITNAYNGIVNIWNGVVSFFQWLWNGVSTGASNIWSGIVSFISSAYTSVTNAWNKVVGFFSGIWNGIKDGARELFDWLANKFSWVADVISSISSAWSGIKSGVSSGWESIKAGAKKMVGLNTGGYVKTEGVALLHPNEVVVNDELTQGLRNFLAQQESNSIIRNTPTPTESGERVTINNISLASTNEPQVASRRTVDPTRLITNVSNNTTMDKSTSTETVDNSITFTEGSIQITMNSGTEQEINALVKKLFTKIQREQELRNTLKYRPRTS